MPAGNEVGTGVTSTLLQIREKLAQLGLKDLSLPAHLVVVERLAKEEGK